MSGTANEHEQPGGNYPDRGDTAATGPAEGHVRSDSGYGGALAHDVPPGPASRGTQDAPREDTHETTDEDRLQGIVMQTRADVGDASENRIADVLRQRIAEVGLDVGDDRVTALAAEIADR